MKIPITKPMIGPEELAAVQEPLKAGWVVQGPYVEKFESAAARFMQARNAVAVHSCTAALHIGAALLGVRPGDEVIVPAFTWISTANVVEYLGGKPIFCDITLETFNLDPARIEALITPRTVGILSVHLFGLCADMPRILEIARKHHLWVMEDAACALGSKLDGKHAGTFGQVGCFSFHPRKSITTGEGGLLICSDPDLENNARSLRDHGAARSDRARHQAAWAFLLSEFNQLGYNYRMTDIQAALGVVQFDRLEWILSQRAHRAARYTAMLQSSGWLRPPVTPPKSAHSFQSYVCLYAPEPPTMDNVNRLSKQRNHWMSELEALGIATRQGTHAPVNTGFYKSKYGLKPESYPNALLAESLSVALPLYPQMTDPEQDYVITGIQEKAPHVEQP